MHNHGLGAWMAKRRLKSPDKIALIYGDGDTVTYRELADGADRVSALLWQRGVRKGDRVAFLGENSPEFLAGAVRCGAARRRVRAGQHPARTAGDRARARATPARASLIHDPELADADRRRCRRRRARHRDRRGLGREPGPRRGCSGTHRGGHADARVVLDDPAAIIYTSGTTGKREGRRAHPREPHLGRAQLRRRLRRRLDRRRADDLAALPRRLARHGCAAGHPQGRARSCSRRASTPAARSRSSSGTASRC